MKRSTILGTIAAGAAALTYTAYRKEMRAATLRILTGRRVIDSPDGPIEFAESGVGPAVLVIHGAGGGFDQGLELAGNFLGEGYRVIAPSRFGYLGTALPEDASPQAQADAHVRVLDALHLDKVPVIGVSAGGPSALQFALRHPDRCAALVMIVPLAYAPGRPAGRVMSPLFATVVNTVLSSNFVLWTATKVAHSTLVETILGTPLDVYRNATPESRRGADQVLHCILPVSKRVKGLANEMIVASNLTQSPLETLRVPLLAISAEDCGYGTYESARYTAGQANGKFIGYATGGHLLMGHEAAVRSAVTSFLNEHLVKPEPAVQEEAEALV
jgi:pimeloyl-ACP methyl ester carboxylesterase